MLRAFFVAIAALLFAASPVLAASPTMQAQPYDHSILGIFTHHQASTPFMQYSQAGKQGNTTVVRLSIWLRKTNTGYILDKLLAQEIKGSKVLRSQNLTRAKLDTQFCSQVASICVSRGVFGPTKDGHLVNWQTQQSGASYQLRGGLRLHKTSALLNTSTVSVVAP